MSKYYINHNIKMDKKLIRSGTENIEIEKAIADKYLEKGSIIPMKDYEASKNAVILSKDQLAKELVKATKKIEELEAENKELKEKGKK